ncbi:amt-3 [Cordylochernes scorpioides]|uniref:Amt-3 n=1 Tax=Cordylochernes scorpioides TaxID=51811 RepID=A0ABY6L786_9ARAC|nr:amt-3 [Cordylochernes scorpioides]
MSSSKRRATSDLNSDNWDKEDSDPEEPGEFAKVDQVQLSQRIVKKAKRSLNSSDISRLDFYATTGEEAGSIPIQKKRKIDSVEQEETTMNIKKEVTHQSDSGSKASPFSGFKGFTNKPSSGALFSFGAGSSTAAPAIPATSTPATSTPATSTLATSTPASITTSTRPKDYFHSLARLNEAVLKWLQEHFDKHAYCDFTPVFKDYAEHLKKLDKEYPLTTSSSSDKPKAEDKPEPAVSKGGTNGFGSIFKMPPTSKPPPLFPSSLPTTTTSSGTAATTTTSSSTFLSSAVTPPTFSFITQPAVTPTVVPLSAEATKSFSFGTAPLSKPSSVTQSYPDDLGDITKPIKRKRPARSWLEEVKKTTRRSLDELPLTMHASEISEDDATWILTGAFIIFTMQSGFSLMESGLVAKRCEVHAMLKNVGDVVFSGLAYWMFGYGLTVGGGPEAWLLDVPEEEMGTTYAAFVYQLSLAATTGTIVSGALAERCRFGPYCGLAFLLGVAYCGPARWMKYGLLHNLGAVDQASCAAVHLVGGSSAFISILYLGPRIIKPQVPASPSNALLGTFILCVDSELEDVTPLDEKLLREGLQLSGKLEIFFIQNDNDVERALKFQRDLKFCMSGYRELYKELVKPSQRLITDYLVKEKKSLKFLKKHYHVDLMT